jgi:predicted secreted protein
MTGRRWIALVVLVVIGAALLVTVVLVRWRDGSPPTNAAPVVYHQGDSIAVANGAEFVLSLRTNPSTGYSWTSAGDLEVTFVSSRQLAGGNQPGASGTQELTFRATNAGTGVLEHAYARPFESGVPPVKTARFPITVRR